MASTLLSDFASWFDASSQPRPRADRAITALPAMVQVLEARQLLTVTVNSTNTNFLDVNAPTLTITGSGFNAVPTDNTVVLTDAAGKSFNVAAGGLGTTSLTVSLPSGLTAGPLSATVTNSANMESNATPAQVASLRPVVNSTTAFFFADDDLVITGLGFDPANNGANNKVTFVDGAGITITDAQVIDANPTTLIIKFNTKPTAGALTAIVETNGVPDEAAIRVATIRPVITPNQAAQPANQDTVVIQGCGFDATNMANNTVVLVDALGTTLVGTSVVGVSTDGTALTVRLGAAKPSAGALTATVTVINGPAAAPVTTTSLSEQVKTITPVVTPSTSSLAIGATTLVINGVGFNPNKANNTVTLTDGAGHVITDATVTTVNAAGTSLTVTFATPPFIAGQIYATVVSNGQSSGAAVPVATIAPIVTASASPQAANLTKVVILGSGFDSSNAANNSVLFDNGAVGVVDSVNQAGTQLVVTLTSLPMAAGPLKATVITNGVSSGAKVQVAAVTPVLETSKACVEANANTIILTGFGFDQITPGNNKVTFSNGVKGDVTDATATTLTVTFTTKPTTAGPLTAYVTTNTYSSGPAVLVANISPTVNSSTSPLPVNSRTVTITGYGFDTKAANNKVTFNNGAVGNVTAATATTLTVTFATPPSKAGSLTAVVTTNGVSSEHHVQVASVTPAITPSVSPLAANATTLSIRGAGFDPVALNNKVTFDNGAVGYVKSVNKTGTLLTVAFLTQPTTAGVLKATVVVNGQNDGAAPVSVATVIPVITSSAALLPANATTLTINGYGFDPNSSSNKVTLSNGAVGTVTAVNATGTSMTITLTSAPTSAGPIKASVITNGQSSGTPLIVATASPLPALPFNLPAQGGQSGLPKQLPKLPTPQKTQPASILSLLTRRRR